MRSGVVVRGGPELHGVRVHGARGETGHDHGRPDLYGEKKMRLRCVALSEERGRSGTGRARGRDYFVILRQ